MMPLSEISSFISQTGICAFLILYMWWRVMPILDRIDLHLANLEALFLALAPHDTAQLLQEMATLRNRSTTKG